MITRVKLSSVAQGLPKYRSMLAGNSSYFLGDFYSIATASIPSATSTVTFDSIPQTYTHLQLRITSVITAGGNVGMRFNNNSSSSYQSHQVQGDGSSVVPNSTGTETALSRLGLAVSTTQPFVAVIDILDYTNTNKYKTVRSFNGQDANTASTDYRVGLGSGLWMNTAAISRIDLATGMTYGTNSTIALYGIKG